MDVMLTQVNKYTNKSLLTCAITLAVQTLGYNTCLYNPFLNQSYIKRKDLEDPDNQFYYRYKTHIDFVNTYKFGSLFTEGENSTQSKDEVNLTKVYFEYRELLSKYDAIISEDTDTLMTPLNDDLLNYDLVKMLDIPVALVTSPCDDWFERLLYSINCVNEMGIRLRGVIFTRFPRCPKNNILNVPKNIAKYSSCPILGIIREFNENTYIPTVKLAYLILANINMSKLMGQKIYYPNYIHL